MKAVILYLPVIHKGHLDLLERQKPDALYILGQSLKNKFPLLERDLRALSSEDILLEAKALSLAPDIRILEESNVSELDSYNEIVLTEDEVGGELRKLYFPHKKVIVDTAFIRWSAVKAFSKLPPQDNATITEEEFDKEVMSKARSEARKSSDWWRQVGAVIIQHGEVILSGHNRHKPSEESVNIDGDPRSNIDAGTHLDLYTALHGEAGLIAEAAREGKSIEGASIYVTTFPCPTCAMLIAKSGIKKVYYADGYSVLNSTDVLREEGIELIRVIETA